MKKQFSTICEERILENFKKTCSEYGVAMSSILEGLMNEFCNEEYIVTITKEGISLQKKNRE